MDHCGQPLIYYGFLFFGLLITISFITILYYLDIGQFYFLVSYFQTFVGAFGQGFANSKFYQINFTQ